jgi:hypothetical protein
VNGEQEEVLQMKINISTSLYGILVGSILNDLARLATVRVPPSEA